MEQFCRHFTGLMDEQCSAGVLYESIKIGHFTTWPCTHPEYRSKCSKAEEYTAEDVAEHDRQVTEAVTEFNNFMMHKSEDCPQCGGHVDYLRQIGRCVYTYPCGCRICQGRVPDVWQQ